MIFYDSFFENWFLDNMISINLRGLANNFFPQFIIALATKDSKGNKANQSKKSAVNFLVMKKMEMLLSTIECLVKKYSVQRSFITDAYRQR